MKNVSCLCFFCFFLFRCFFFYVTNIWVIVTMYRTVCIRAKWSINYKIGEITLSSLNAETLITHTVLPPETTVVKIRRPIKFTMMFTHIFLSIKNIYHKSFGCNDSGGNGDSDDDANEDGVAGDVHNNDDGGEILFTPGTFLFIAFSIMIKMCMFFFRFSFIRNPSFDIYNSFFNCNCHCAVHANIVNLRCSEPTEYVFNQQNMNQFVVCVLLDAYIQLQSNFHFVWPSKWQFLYTKPLTTHFM